MTKFFSWEKPELGPEPLDETKKQKIYEALSAKFADKSDIDNARANSDRVNNVADWGSIVEGLVKSRSVALGGSGVDKDFYDGLRDNAEAKVDIAESDRKEEMLTYLRDKQGLRQFDQDNRQIERQNSADKIAADSVSYGKERDGVSDDHWQQTFDKKAESGLGQLPFVMRMDSFGNPVVMDKRTGKLVRGEAGERIAKQLGQTNQNNPPAPIQGENKDQYKARMSLWTAKEKDKTMTDAQGKAAGQILKMQDATKGVDNNFTISSGAWDEMRQQTQQNKLWEGSIGTLLEASGVAERDRESDILKGHDQRAMAARRMWADAYVRSTSGAVVGESELSSEQLADKSAAAMDTFMPQKGDDEATVIRKREMRAAAEESVMVRTKPDTVAKSLPVAKIKVTNGSETLMIDAADLQDAMSDGYKEVK